MRLFQSARFKLTAWYLLMIMTISLAFSAILYYRIDAELNRGLQMHSIRMLPPEQLQLYEQQFKVDENGRILEFRQQPVAGIPVQADLMVLQEVKRRVLWLLLLVNLVILWLSAGAGYFLAGKTLSPIEKMVDDQKRFIADASHELRTPLTALRSEIEVALREPKLGGKEAKELLQSNLEEVDKMQSLTNYLLAMSKYENDQVKLPVEKVNLAEAARRAMERVKHQAAAKKVTLVDELQEVETEANGAAMVELITILADNAVKYSHEAGEVVVRVFKKKKTAIIEVQDQGIGIKASDVPYIFNRFYRADSSRSKKQIEGYGLGLSIAKSIVHMHGGSIHVESEVGKGSLFRVKL